jgi:formate hydrogenlyase subunit 3/multisubunit Na+/H+ antiporter MnhD subunit
MSQTIATFNLPVVLLATLLAVAALTYLLRGWERVSALIAAVVTGGLGLWVWNLDLSSAVRTLPFSSQVVDLTSPLARAGFTLQLQSGSLPVIATSLLLTAAACFLAAFISQGDHFPALALLLVTGYLTVALMVSAPLPPPLLAPLFLTMLAALSVFVLQSGRTSGTGGSLRKLAPPMLAFPLFLVAFWYIDQLPLDPQDVVKPQAAAQLISLGLLILLAPAPLHGAQPASAQSAPPLVHTLVLLLYQLALLHLVFRTLLTFSFVEEMGALHEWLTYAGLATAVWGGLAAAGANHPGRLWDYAALHDWGLLILVLAIPGLRSWLLVLFMFGLRSVSMLTCAAGLAMLEERLGELTPERLRGAATRLPWNSAAFLLGGLGLVGFPLSAGFTGHWAALQLIAESDWLPAAIVLIASGGAIFGFIRLARDLYGPLQNRHLLREGMAGAVLAMLVLLLSVGLAIVPQWLDNPITRTLAALRG